MATPHLEFKEEDVSNIVLMPGDPLRAKFIAENFLNDVKLINTVRNMFGYTGYYKGKKISIIGSGMGIPSMGIYSYELFKYYNVDKIIRIGTCGAISKDLKLFDTILVNNVYSNSPYAYELDNSNDKIVSSSKNLTNTIEEVSVKNGINIIRGDIFTSEVFTPYKKYEYNSDIKNSCIADEMETFALFYNAKVLNKEASCLLSVVDSPFIPNKATIEEREKELSQMIVLALESSLNL